MEMIMHMVFPPCIVCAIKNVLCHNQHLAYSLPSSRVSEDHK
jgi:hypothetical protein